MKHFNVKIVGEVQGVNFRTDAKFKAEQLGLTGLVRNQPNGTLYLEVEGDDEAVQKFLQWCEQGSAWSEVQQVEAQEGPVQNYQEFKIDYA